jgi:rfaE bifunctional protein nucleotidyltransferase chain/domain
MIQYASRQLPSGEPRGTRLGQVVSQRDLLSRRGEWKRSGSGLVCAYGGFGLLHPGHVRLLDQSRELGNILAVGVQSDATVRAGAGQNAPRPITPATERAEIVAALSAVDFAAIIDSPLEQFLKNLRPDVFVCGDEPISSVSGFAKASDLEYALAEIGCNVVRLALEPGYSTSRLIERILDRRT